MTIKEVAEKFDITTDTLRYYERIGLIPSVPRTASGIRDFDEVTINWVEFALCFKKAGVPLEGIVEYVKLALQGVGTEPARREILVETRENLLEKLEEIQSCLELLNHKIAVHIHSNSWMIGKQVSNKIFSRSILMLRKNIFS